MAKTFVEQSRLNWTPAQGEKCNTDQLMVGCMQRIAEANEHMAKNFVQLQADNEWLKKRNKALSDRNEHLQRSANVYKGKYNSLKNKK